MRLATPILACLLALALGACSSSGKSKWGRTATFCPPRSRTHRALVDAALDPQTVIPVAGALLLGLTDADEAVSDWAREEAPLFGSSSRADDASDVLLGASGLLAVGTALATPSGCQPAEVWGNKARGLAVEAGAVAGAGGLAVLLKETTGRWRPDGSDDKSFPSAHTTFASACSALTWRNCDALCTTRRRKTALKTSATGLALLTGWARVEGGRHYPSDVLTGYALGNFTSRVVHDSFLGRHGWCVGARWRRDPGTLTLQIGKDL